MKFPWPLRYTIPGVILLFGLLLSAGFFAFDRRMSHEQVEILVNRHLRFMGNQISAVSAHFLAKDDIAGLQSQISALGADPILQMAFVCDDQGKVLVSSRYEFTGEPLEHTPLAKRRLLLGTAPSKPVVTGDGRTLLGIFPFSLPPRAGELVSTRNAYLLLEYDLEYPKGQVTRGFVQRSTFCSVVLALACLLGWAFFHFVLNTRIGRLINFTERLAAGETLSSAGLNGSDEISKLSRAFEAMAQKISCSTAELRDANGRMSREIAERKYIEEALRNSERRFRSIWENSHEAMRLTDSKGTVLAVNPAYARLMEQPVQELVQRPLNEKYEDDLQEKLARCQSGFGKKNIERYEQKKVTLKSGRVLHLEISYSFIEMEQARPLLLGIFRDISDRVAVLEKLQEAKEFSENLINTANVMIVAVNREGRITTFNETAEKVSGYTKAEARGRLWTDFVRGHAREPGEMEPIARKDFEAELVTKPGDVRLISWQTNVIREHGTSTGTICFGIDITDRQKQESNRLELERKLLDAQKLESLGVLAGGIAHDFNNLLAAILGNTNLAQMHISAGSQVAGYLKNVEKTSLRAADLCRQMLAYSGKGRFTMHYLDLNEVVRETLELLEVSITKKAALRVELRPGIPTVHADPAQIRQVIMNLVINASEALGETSGLIRIRTGIIQADAQFFADAHTVSELPEGEYVFMEVTDTGCGMSPETRARIFEPFYTTKFTGRGLGLAAVLGIVRGHNGALKIMSEVGQGSTFKFLLPSAMAMPQPLPQSSSSTGAPWRGEGTVLVVDDDPTVRAVTARMVQSSGFEVLQAVDGLHGVEVFSQRQDEIVAVVLDMTMPKLNGREALQEMRRIKPNVRILLISGFSDVATAEGGGSEPDGFLQKPFKPQELNAKLKSIFTNGREPGTGGTEMRRRSAVQVPA